MKKFVLAALLALPVLYAVPSDAQDRAGPVVVELFTSQNCPSCPKADAVLESLSAQPGIIALGCHVTYWDRAGRKDMLARPFCTARQGAYAAYLGLGQHVYTPQMVVNGAVQFNGGDQDRVAAALANGGGQIVLPVNISVRSDKTLLIQLPYLPSVLTAPAKIMVLSYKKRSASYVNPVLALVGEDEWAGEAKAVSFTPRDPEADGYTVLAQDAANGRILAAGRIER